jgi:hypothetical protein
VVIGGGVKVHKEAARFTEDVAEGERAVGP